MIEVAKLNPNAIGIAWLVLYKYVHINMNIISESISTKKAIVAVFFTLDKNNSNSLDTESSIKQGCKYFASLLSSCKNQRIDDLNVAIQSYNYGGGYVGYVAGKGKKHTYNLAESFAREKSGGKKVTYTNPIAAAKNGGWRYQYGNQFYVELVNQYLAVPQVSGELAQKVMNEALKYQGWKYVYGGSNPNTAFDCSGLTQWCYRKAGISLPRTAQMQYDATQHLPLSQAKAGDLVFFHSTYNAGSYVTHVGIVRPEGRKLEVD